jgi:hypothetical protein
MSKSITQKWRSRLWHGARTFSALCALLCAMLLMTGCGSLYKVKSRVEAPIPESAPRNEAGGLVVRAAPLLTDEESQELFESNLPLAGLLPVRVELANTGSAALEIKRARFRLTDATGAEWKYRTAKQTISRILDANGVAFYNPQARAKFEEAFRQHALNTESTLAPAERRQGLIFFQRSKKESVNNPRELRLTIERLAEPIELRLN